MLHEMTFAPYPNEVFTTFSFFGFLMCIIPLPWHLKSWNGGTCLFMFWTGTGCLIFFINSIVWHGNAFNSAPIWCDICAKIIIGTTIGIPASSLCINRRLYLVQLNPAAHGATITKSDKMRVLSVDLSISLGLPIILMILHYIPQGHRFNIFEDVGCHPQTYNTWVAVLIKDVPPVLVGIVSATYAIRATISINKRRTEFNGLLSRHLNVTSSLYFRLMFLAGIEVLLTVPITGFSLIYNVMHDSRPWISWEDTHSYFNRVDQYPAIIWHGIPGAEVIEFNRWLYVLCAIVFFSFFGFAGEAILHYRLAIRSFLKIIGIRGARHTEILGAGPIMSQRDPADRLTFANKRRHQAESLSTSMASSSPSSHRQGRTQDHLGTQTDSDFPTIPPPSEITPQVVIDEIPHRNSLVSPQKPQVPTGVGQFEENERRPRSSEGTGSTGRITRNLRSFLDLSHPDPSTNHVSFPHSLHISNVEEGQPSNAKRRSSSRFSRFRSFLTLN